MQHNQSTTGVQAPLEECLQQLPGPLSPQDLPQLLHLGLSQMIDAALAKERQLHLETHPEDRANG